MSKNAQFVWISDFLSPFPDIEAVLRRIAGFGMGGWVVDHWGWPAALLLDAATYGVSVISLALIRYRSRPRATSEASLGGYLKASGTPVGDVTSTTMRC